MSLPSKTTVDHISHLLAHESHRLLIMQVSLRRAYLDELAVAEDFAPSPEFEAYKEHLRWMTQHETAVAEFNNHFYYPGVNS